MNLINNINSYDLRAAAGVDPNNPPEAAGLGAVVAPNRPPAAEEQIGR